MSRDAETWRQVRRLFEQVCELPQARWQGELERLSGDPQVIEETLALLSAQTARMTGLVGQLDGMLERVVRDELGVGDHIGHWTLRRHLASGGMGSVFEAERDDGLYRQKVAIKLLRDQPGGGIAGRLAAERQIMASFQHPNIARLYDGGSTPAGQPYLVMEHVEGHTLDRHLRETGIGLDARIDLFLKICDAVQAAHAHMVLHCDLKPGNVMVRAGGEPVLLDFGIARALGADEAADRGRFCTLPYASPELLAGGPVGVASDVFGLGIMLLELLADARVQRSSSDARLPLPEASMLAGTRCAWRRRLRGDLDAIAGKACEIDPERRYGTVADLAADLRRQHACRPVSARAGGWVYRSGRFLRRRWRETAVAGIVLALCGGFVWNLERARDEARAQAQTAARVSDFLVGAFDAADPKMRGRNGTENIRASDILDKAARSIDEDLSAEPRVRARLRAVIGRAYMNLTLTAKAEPLLRKAAAELQAPGVDQPDEAASALHDLSLLLSRTSRGDEAIAPARQAFAIAEKSSHVGALSGAGNILGLALQQAGKLDEAEVVLTRALARRRRQMADEAASGKVEAFDGDILHNLALVMKDRGDYAGAERRFREEMAAVVQRYGSGSLRHEVSNYDLARVLLAEGKMREGIGMLERGLPLARSLYPAGSDALQTRHAELAGAYQDAGDARRAQQYYDEAAVQLRLGGREGTLDHALLLNNRATLLEDRGDVPGALALYRQSLALRRKLAGPDAKMVHAAEANLGRLLMRSGKFDEAEPLLERARTGLSRLLGPDTPVMAVQRLTVAETRMRKGDCMQARQSLDSAAPTGGWPGAPLRVRAETLAAGIDRCAGDDASAATRLTRLVEQERLRLEPSALPLAKLRLSLAQSLAGQGLAAGARAQLALAEPVLRTQMVAGAKTLHEMDELAARLH